MAVTPEERLLAHLKNTETWPFRVSHALLNFACHGVPEHRDSYNPIKRLAAEIGVWIDDAQIRRTNRRLDG